MEEQADRRDAIEQRAHQVFDASVEALDEDTRLRLSQARFEAVGTAERRASAWRRWVPVAAVAATVLVAVVVWRVPEPVSSPSAAAGNGDAPAEVVELLADGDDLDLVENDLEFYQWLDTTGMDPAGSTG